MSFSERSGKSTVDRLAPPRLGQDVKNLIAASAKRELGMPDAPPLRGERSDLRPSVAVIRKRLNLSQREFAHRFGLSIKTIQHWEQSRTVPDRPAVVLLKTIEIAPDVVSQAVVALTRPLELNVPLPLTAQPAIGIPLRLRSPDVERSANDGAVKYAA